MDLLNRFHDSEIDLSVSIPSGEIKERGRFHGNCRGAFAFRSFCVFLISSALPHLIVDSIDI